LIKVAAAQPDRGSEGGHVVHGKNPNANFKSRRSANRSALSALYIENPIPICRKFDKHADRLLDPFARASAGNNKPAMIAMIATTTSNSTKVNPRRRIQSPKYRPNQFL
jgi:hypothetical protein